MPKPMRDLPAGCPPDAAVEGGGECYRIVRGPAVEPDDLKSYYEMGLRPRPTCAVCGISLYNTFDGALHRLELGPSLGTAIARGHLTPEAGKSHLSNAASGHLNWWPYEETDRPAFFHEVTPCT
jgi:hypothetical protein